LPRKKNLPLSSKDKNAPNNLPLLRP
jgi:hypothetical protein